MHARWLRVFVTMPWYGACSACLTADVAERLGAKGPTEVHPSRPFRSFGAHMRCSTTRYRCNTLTCGCAGALWVQVMKHPWFSAVDWDAVTEVSRRCTVLRSVAQ